MIQYRKVMDGADNTVKSIIISVNARLAFLENEAIKELLEMDELHFGELGTGKNSDKKTMTALFIVTPDSDKSYAFLVGMLYEQLMQELYFQADTKYGGRLPIHVSMYLDEFYNTPLPDSYLNFLSTMRSREILGKRGSSSRNYDVLDRELMTPDEVRKLDNKKCIVLIRGCDPVIDSKFNTFKHPYVQT